MAPHKLFIPARRAFAIISPKAKLKSLVFIGYKKGFVFLKKRLVIEVQNYTLYLDDVMEEHTHYFCVCVVRTGEEW